MGAAFGEVCERRLREPAWLCAQTRKPVVSLSDFPSASSFSQQGKTSAPSGEAGFPSPVVLRFFIYNAVGEARH